MIPERIGLEPATSQEKFTFVPTQDVQAPDALAKSPSLTRLEKRSLGSCPPFRRHHA